jgi:alpha-1,6-mannosyltransferase
MASADAMLHGSSAETYGIVIAEAICSGLPLIVPSVGGANDLAGTQYAETYNPGDVKDCARAIHALLNKDRSKLSNASIEAAETKVATVSQHFEGLFRLYQELAADS